MSQVSAEKMVIAGGCFWCLEAIFRRVRGVLSVRSGYTGGSVANPSYEDVCRGNTGHVEAIEILFDSALITRNTLLDIFFGMHDPTTPNQQGNDIGSQYASVAFFETVEQKNLIEQKIRSIEAAHTFEKPIITRVDPLGRFYPAETYHDSYYEKNPNQGYCQLVINPKVASFRKKYAQWFQEPSR